MSAYETPIISCMTAEVAARLKPLGLGRAALHDWRLIREQPMVEGFEDDPTGARARAKMREGWSPGTWDPTNVIGVHRQWHCTRCRTVEWTSHPGEVWLGWPK